MPTNEAKVYRLAEMSPDQPMPGVERRRIVGEQSNVASVRFAKGTEVPRHHHASEQMVLVLRGRIRFTLGEGDSAEEVEVAEREILLLPSDIVHGAVFLEDTEVIDIFAPPEGESGLDRAGN